MNDWKNTIKRTLRTFVQAALGYAVANIVGIVGEGDGFTKNALTTLLVASVAAGIAAVMNLPAGANQSDNIETIDGQVEVRRSDASIKDVPSPEEYDLSFMFGNKNTTKGDEDNE